MKSTADIDFDIDTLIEYLEPYSHATITVDEIVDKLREYLADNQDYDYQEQVMYSLSETLADVLLKKTIV